MLLDNDTTGGEPGPNIILSDLRTEPILAALHLARSFPGSRVLISETSLKSGDFGDRIRGLSRRLRVQLFRIFAPVTVVSVRHTTPDHEECRGCRASLVSIAADAEARPEKHVETWEALSRLCDGGAAIAEVLSSTPGKIFLFNGRLASVRKISQLTYSEGFSVSVYEWAPRRGTFKLYSYPMHDPTHVSAEIVEFARARDFRFSSERAERFSKQKLNNRFSRGRTEEPQSRYRSVIFPGSPYEYRWAFDNSDYLDANLELLLQKATSHREFHRPAALRLHPRAGEFGQDGEKEEELRSVCDRFQVDLIGERSTISTRFLIEKADTIMVGATTVSLDAFLMGKVPIFLGHNSYRGLIEEVIEKVGSGHEARMLAAGAAAEYFDSHVNVLAPPIQALGRMLRAYDTLASKLSRGVRY